MVERLYSFSNLGLTEGQQDALEGLMVWSDLSLFADYNFSGPIGPVRYSAKTPEEKARLDALLKREQELEMKRFSSLENIDFVCGGRKI